MNGFKQLTKREQELVKALLDGALTNRQLAAVMFVTERTVATHLSNIFTKLGLDNRAHLILMAERSGFFPPKTVKNTDDSGIGNPYNGDEWLFYVFRLALPVEEMPADVMERVRQRVMTTIERMARSGGGGE